MTRKEDARLVLERQLELGSLPADPSELKPFLEKLERLAPLARIHLHLDPSEAEKFIATATSAGLRAARAKSGASLEFPADGHLLSHCFHLLGERELAAIDWAPKLIDALDRAPASGTALPTPEWTLVAQLAAPTAARLGFDPEVKLLPVLVANAKIERDRSRLKKRGRSLIALSADHLRFLTSLDPPALVPYDFEEARRRGVPEISATHLGLVEKSFPIARAGAGAAWIEDASVSHKTAKACLEELDRAWGGGIESISTIGWPIYLPRGGEGSPLDAVAGAPLPDIY